MKCTLFILLSFFLMPDAQGQGLYVVKKGSIVFKSNAPQEDIQARSTAPEGLMDIQNNTFAFKVEILSFNGFNSALQQEHFYENYMETPRFPNASYSGKLIDKFNPDLVTQKLRSKGVLEIHGVKKERIIEVVIQKSASGYIITSDFNVLLSDHGIVVPKIVFQKIAENIKVNTRFEMSVK